MTRRTDDRLDELAATVHRLAVLLTAGVPPAAAWRYLAEGSASPLVEHIADGAWNPGGIPAAITSALPVAAAERDDPSSSSWRAVAAAWAVATEVGAPLAPVLREVAESLRELGELRRAVAVSLAAPVATARTVAVLPALGVLLGIGLGFDPVHVLLGTPAGIACAATGALLVAIAVLWNRALVRRARRTVGHPGLEVELTAIALAGGGSPGRAREVVAAALRDHLGMRPSGVADQALDFSRRAGVPAAELLRAEAREQRRAARSEAQRRAQALSARMMLPMGLCVLPAFMLLGVAPLVISVVTSTLSGL
ncbi:type II secretion system F family protein [Galbitalea soli]|uniref:Type II secretion system protein GspF domain-containing protein n=1 Tax=Galbitalea soli TaxID=1268042 RepID=A0A7C9PPK8_9MICO|nr:type II secretion system F family protein [Galbitalea soli]NEM92188.1 hypothetical protein [Galbitalea soli]NYJ31858.1 tight adherence protein B [Galbitalea soli]